MDPTERSIPRVTITRSIPSDRTAITAVCARTLPMFRGVRKSGVVIAMTAIRRTSIRTGPARSRNKASRNGPSSRVGESGDEAFASCAVPAPVGKGRWGRPRSDEFGVLGSTHPLTHHCPPVLD